MAEKTIMNIYEKMLHIQTEIPTVAKNLDVSTGYNGPTYKAVSERDVKDAVKPLEAKYGVYSFPVTKELIEQSFLETSTKNGMKKSFYIREKVTYRFVNIEKPEEFIDIVGYGDGIDTGDKSPGKADTYAGKYCLMSAYKISTGDDPDRDASQEYGSKGEQPKTEQPPSNDDMANVLQEFNDTRRAMAAKGMDIRDKEVSDFICMKANVTSVDPGKLNRDDLIHVTEVMKAVVKAKK